MATKVEVSLQWVTNQTKFWLDHSSVYNAIMITNTLCKNASSSTGLGCNMGTGKPVVFPKWVIHSVGFWHTTTHHVPTPQCSRVYYSRVIIIISILKYFLSFFIIILFTKFIMSHCDGTKYGYAASHTTFWLSPPPQLSMHGKLSYIANHSFVL